MHHSQWASAHIDFATHLILTPTLSSAACCATRARVDWATRPCATRARVDANSCHFLLAQALATFQPRCVDVRHSLSHFLCVLRQATESLTRAPDQETFANGLAALTGACPPPETSSRSRSDIGTHMQRVNMFAPMNTTHQNSLSVRGAEGWRSSPSSPHRELRGAFVFVIVGGRRGERQMGAQTHRQTERDKDRWKHGQMREEHESLQGAAN